MRSARLQFFHYCYFYLDTQPEPLRRGEILLERLSIKFTSNGKREFVRFFFTCRLLFIISTPKLVVSRNFLSIRVVLSCFICSFSILRNSQLESVNVKLKLSTISMPYFSESSLPGLLDHLRRNWHRWASLLLNHPHSSPLATRGLTRLAEDLDPALARLHFCWGMPWLICLEDQAKGTTNIIVLQFPSYHRQTTLIRASCFCVASLDLKCISTAA